MSHREENKPIRKPFFEDERIPQNVKDIMKDLVDRGIAKEMEPQEYYTIWLNPPPSWRPKKEEQQPQGAVIQASQQKEEEKKKTKWGIVREEIRDFLFFLLGPKIRR